MPPIITALTRARASIGAAAVVSPQALHVGVAQRAERGAAVPHSGGFSRRTVVHRRRPSRLWPRSPPL